MQGAAGAGLSAAMAKQLDDIYKGVGSATGSELLGSIAANVVAGVGGALVGGAAGAATASNVELYNQSLHRKKNDLVAQACSATGQCNEAVLNAAIQAQGDNAQLALGTMSPDHVSIQGNIYIASGGVVINLHNGDTFGSWALGKPIPTYSLKPGLSVTFGSILGGGGAEGTSSYLAGGGANASTFVPVPGFPAIGAGGGISHAYGGQTSIEYGLGFPPGTAVNPISYGFDMKK
ncbi:filamentous hemagglutinin [Paraburkholderia lycopersici]|uniref:Filamentous hemagglutinin n=1 Tax=Paraburkholderia lycopersici TaxID=416944 RepID=A0A1G6MXC2_9BURK|nr:filamentous hemagglutinin [Paraburkholderia lycopersici]